MLWTIWWSGCSGNRPVLTACSRLTLFLAELQTPPETAPLLDLENSLGALRQGTAEISQQQSALAGLTEQLDQKKAEIQTYLQDTGLCPLCGSPLDLEHFLENQHA